MSQAVEQFVEHEAWQFEAIKKSLEKLESGKAQLVGHEEVAHWLSSWGTGAEAECPKCR